MKDPAKEPAFSRVVSSATFSFLGTLGSVLGIAPALHWIHQQYISTNPGIESVVWAATTTLLVVVGGLVVVFCAVKHSILNDELNRKAEVASRLEAVLLNKRLSSNKKR